MRSSVLIAALLASGCGDIPRELEKVLEANAGVKEEVVVLAARPTRIGPKVLSFVPSAPINSFNRTSGLCAALANGMPYNSRHAMDAAFQRLTAGGRVAGALVLKSGRRIQLEDGNQAWSMNGALGGKNQLSVCTWLHEKLSPSDPVVRLELTSSQPFPVLGVYWHTESEMGAPHGS